MIHLIYVSSATKDMNDNDLISLLQQSRARNERQGITGMLLYAGGNFFQVLEGEKKDVEEIYDAIVKDERNTGNIVIVNAQLDERSFPDWTMGFRCFTEQNMSDIKGYTEFLEKDMALQEIAGKTNDVISLIYQFKQNI